MEMLGNTWRRVLFGALAHFLNAPKVMDSELLSGLNHLVKQVPYDLVAHCRDADLFPVPDQFANHPCAGKGLSGSRWSLNR